LFCRSSPVGDVWRDLIDVRREAAQRDAESVKRGTPRIRLLNTPPHRNLDGERGGELGEDREAGVKPDET
jgi:hypothetical protein